MSVISKFPNGTEMYESLEVSDLYNKETEEYVFLYNEDGAIAVYQISNKEAEELKKKKEETGEDWSAFLWIGGYIYDEPMSFCNEHYKGHWENV